MLINNSINQYVFFFSIGFTTFSNLLYMNIYQSILSSIPSNSQLTGGFIGTGMQLMFVPLLCSEEVSTSSTSLSLFLPTCLPPLPPHRPLFLCHSSPPPHTTPPSAPSPTLCAWRRLLDDIILESPVKEKQTLSNEGQPAAYAVEVQEAAMSGF